MGCSEELRRITCREGMSNVRRKLFEQCVLSIISFWRVSAYDMRYLNMNSSHAIRCDSCQVMNIINASVHHRPTNICTCYCLDEEKTDSHSSGDE